MVNFKQMVGLILLSIGVILLIYSVRTEAKNGTLIAGAILMLTGIVISLAMNKQK